MLVLSRQRDESVMVNDDVEIRVVDIRGDKVKLGFVAPRSVSIHRKEIYDAIRRENQDAARLRPDDLPARVTPPQPTLKLVRPPAEPTGASESQGQAPVAKEGAVMPTPADPFLRAAIDEARKGLAEGGLPIGSVLVRDGRIIGRGHNRRVQSGNPMAHAEIDCLANAGRQKTYKDTVLYSTLMPCFLCSGAVLQFGIPKVVVGESVNFAGQPGRAGHAGCGKSPDLLRQCGVDLTDLADAECVAMMRDFIAANPTLWNEDIGA
jgi:cytosine deaminase